VLNAGLSTLVAISMMALASSRITFTFFKMFCGMVAVGTNPEPNPNTNPNPNLNQPYPNAPSCLR